MRPFRRVWVGPANAPNLSPEPACSPFDAEANSSAPVYAELKHTFRHFRWNKNIDLSGGTGPGRLQKIDPESLTAQGNGGIYLICVVRQPGGPDRQNVAAAEPKQTGLPGGSVADAFYCRRGSGGREINGNPDSAGFGGIPNPQREILPAG